MSREMPSDDGSSDKLPSEPPGKEQDPHLQDVRILVVEDEHLIADELVRCLTELRGRSHGSTIEQALRSNRPGRAINAAVLDVSVGGFHLTKIASWGDFGFKAC